ncbi:MAG: bilirubin oxidase [Bacteroidetes bacterium]|nr:MAG: bilirubin oxidase [Bacteroidota bacterium]
MKTINTLGLLSLSFLFSTTIIAQNPLVIPPALSGTDFDLTIQHGSVEFTPGVTTSTMGVNGDILGPTLIFTQGETVNIAVHNEIGDTTTVHWHGMHIPAAMDGGPHTPIPPGTTWNPTFTIMDHASTMWYHPHLMHKTNTHIQMGIAGFVIIKDAEEAALNLPRTYGVDDIPVVFQTKTIDENGQIDTDMAHAGMDTLVLANGTPNAYFDAPAQMFRVRMLDASSERSYNIGLSNNAPFVVIGSDGGLLTSGTPLTRLLISPGERYEIIIDLSGLEGESVQIMNYGSAMPAGVYGNATTLGPSSPDPIPFYYDNPLNGSDFALLTLNVGPQTANPVLSTPQTLAATTDLEYSSVDFTRQILMSPVGGMMGPQGLTGPFQFNGNLFDMNVVNYEVDLNNTEVWTITNQSAISHPFHIHDVQFNIQEYDGGLPPPHMQGWKDVVLIPPFMGTVKFITKFEDFADPDVPYMYHCHILVHEEGGMMGQFVVIDREGVGSVIENETFSLYPNPASENIRIELNNVGSNEITIRDISGRTVMVLSINGASTSLDVSSFIPGVYFVSIGNTTARFIKD